MTTFMEPRNEEDIETDKLNSLNTFEQRILANPFWAIKLWEFLLQFKDTYLKEKIFKVTKDSSFITIVGDYQNIKSDRYKELWLSNLPKSINNYLDDIEGNDDIKFNRNEIEEVKTALSNIFSINETNKTIWKIKSTLKKIVK